MDDNTPRHATHEPWWREFLTPAFRRWAYGVSAAAVSLGAVLAERPEFAATAVPLLLALFYVTPEGDAR